RSRRSDRQGDAILRQLGYCVYRRIGGVDESNGIEACCVDRLTEDHIDGAVDRDIDAAFGGIRANHDGSLARWHKRIKMQFVSVGFQDGQREFIAFPRDDSDRVESALDDWCGARSIRSVMRDGYRST